MISKQEISITAAGIILVSMVTPVISCFSTAMPQPSPLLQVFSRLLNLNLKHRKILQGSAFLTKTLYLLNLHKKTQETKHIK